MSSEYVRSKYQIEPRRTPPELEAMMDAILDRMDKGA